MHGSERCDVVELDFRPIDEASRDLYATWFHDPGVQRGAAFPDSAWFDYVTTHPHAMAWAVYRDGRMVAQVQVDAFPGESAALGIAVDPALPGQGIGTAVLKAFLATFGARFPRIEAHIEPVNTASIALFTRCGFAPVGNVDAEGFQLFQWVTGPGRRKRRLEDHEE